MRILFCGISGVHARNTASANRYLMIGKIAALNGEEVIYLNRPFTNQLINESESAHVFVWSNNLYSNGSFIVRNFIRILTPIKEFLYLVMINRNKKIDVIHVYTPSLLLALFYSMFAFLFKTQTIHHYVELRSSIKSYKKIEKVFIDKLLPIIFKKHIVISNLIESHLKSCGVTDILKIPPVCDFDYFRSFNHIQCDDSYLLFCGSVSYSEVIDFIIEAYGKSDAKQEKLFLVINGSLSEELTNKIKSFNGRIKIFSRLPYSELISLYKGAIALLAPLRDNVQDRARFPQKIAEYVAVNGVIISNEVGEVSLFFKNLFNALVATEYESQQFTEKINWMLKTENKQKITRIKENMNESVNHIFDYSQYVEKLAELTSKK